MSWHPAADPKPGDRFSCDAIETIIVPRAHDLGGFEVRRALPSAHRQMVGPFIFWEGQARATPALFPERCTHQGSSTTARRVRCRRGPHRSITGSYNVSQSTIFRLKS